MAKKIYKCYVCGNIVEILTEGSGSLVCCNENMRLMKENFVDASTEKHVPVIEKVENGYKISVGAILHPMTKEHYIEWIELVTDKTVVHKKFLNYKGKPYVTFFTNSEDVYARAYCNKHGLWQSK